MQITQVGLIETSELLRHDPCTTLLLCWARWHELYSSENTIRRAAE